MTMRESATRNGKDRQRVLVCAAFQTAMIPRRQRVLVCAAFQTVFAPQRSHEAPQRIANIRQRPLRAMLRKSPSLQKGSQWTGKRGAAQEAKQNRPKRTDRMGAAQEAIKNRAAQEAKKNRRQEEGNSSSQNDA